MTSELIVIVPTRSRPHNVGPVVDAWQETGAFEDGGELFFVLDGDDPSYPEYVSALDAARGHMPASDRNITWGMRSTWQPLVPKLNSAAVDLLSWSPYALGFAGDDHRPRTRGWVRAYTDALRAGAGIVYGDDGYQGENLPTQWAMRADIVKALGRMVPAPVEHLYCDNAIKDLGEQAGLLGWLPEVRIEHVHPVAGKAQSDEQYERVNSRAQYRSDRAAYCEWRQNGLAADVALLGHLRKGETHP